MIRTSQIDSILVEIQEARRLANKLREVRAMQPGATLAFTAPEAAPSLGLDLPASMVANGLLQQLRAVAGRLYAQGLVFDEAPDPSDITLPAKRGRKSKPRAAAAPPEGGAP